MNTFEFIIVFKQCQIFFCSLIPDKKNLLNIRYSNSSFLFHNF